MGTPVRREHEIGEEGMIHTRRAGEGLRKVMDLEEGRLGGQKGKKPTELKKIKVKGSGREGQIKERRRKEPVPDN